MNSALLWIGSLLVLVLGALFAVPHFVDWNLYRGTFEEEATRVLGGREVRVTGSVSLRLLPAPYFSFERVRIADLPGDQSAMPGEPLLRAERLTIGLAVAPLLRGAIEVSEVELLKPELKARIGPDDRINVLTFAGAPAALPELAVRSVRVAGGTITVTGLGSTAAAGSREVLRIDAIDGDLSAEPGGLVRWRGFATFGGERRELRLSAADLDKPAVRVKAAVRGQTSGVSYVLDGNLADLAGATRLTGELTARLPTALGPAEPADGRRTSEQAFDLKAKVDGLASGVLLDELAVAFEQDGQPQLISGAARIVWRDELQIEADLSSRWLDLDRVSGREAGVRPVDAADWVRRIVAGIVPPGGRLQALFRCDAINLGKDIASNVSLALAGQDGKLSVEHLRASLPGAARLDLRGSTGDDGRTFAGELVLRAGSLQRLALWASRGLGVPPPPGDGPGLLSARFSAGETFFELIDAEAEIAGQSLRGGIAYGWGGRPRLNLRATAATLDVSSVLPRVLSVGGLRAALGLERTAEPSATAGEPRDFASWFDPRRHDLDLALRIGRLDDGAMRLTNLSGTLSLIGGSLVIDRLAFHTEADARVELRSELIDITGEPRGTGHADIAAERVSAVRDLARMAGLGELADRPDDELEDILPVRLSGSLQLAAGPAERSEAVVDGSFRDSRVRGSAAVKGARLSWPGLLRGGDVDASLVVAGPEAGAAALLLLPASGVAATAQTGATDDRLMAHLAGSLAQGALVHVRLRTTGSDAAFEGRIRTAGEGPVTADGRLTVNAVAAGPLVTRLGSPLLARLADRSLLAVADLTLTETAVRLAFREARVADRSVTGTLVIDRGTTPHRLSLDVDMDEIRVPRLVHDALTAADRPLIEPPTPAGDRTAGPWSDADFDLQLLRSANGDISVRSRRLVIDDGIAVANARLLATLSANGIEARELSGDVLGGRLVSRWRLEPRAADARLEGTLKIAGGSLKGLGDGALDGAFDLELALEGRGTTPRSLVQFLSGAGAVTGTGVSIGGIGAAVAQRAAERVLAADTPPDLKDVEAMLRRELAAARADLGRIELKIEAAQGAARLAPLRLETPEATLSNRTTLDLATLRADSEWRIAPKQATRGTRAKGPLPPLTVVHVGPAVRLGRAEPRVQADDLIRELTVRRMERDVEELERLRRLDEERAKAEAERRRALELTPIAPAAPAATPPSAPAAPLGPPQPKTAPAAAPAPPSPPPLDLTGPRRPARPDRSGTYVPADRPPPGATASLR